MFGTYVFVQISPACGPNTYQLIMQRLETSNISISNGNMKYPIGKSVFAVSLPLKLSPATVVYVGTGSLKSLHTLFNKYLDQKLVEFEQICMFQTT